MLSLPFKAVSLAQVRKSADSGPKRVRAKPAGQATAAPLTLVGTAGQT